MKFEKSCGAVIYKRINNEIVFLIEYMSLGHISLPKGHVEKNETEIETALREIKEETNLDVKILDGFKEKISYSPYQDIYKTVVFFLAIPIKETCLIDKHDKEVNKSEWVNYNKAMELLTYDTDKELIRKAYDFINKHYTK